MKPTAVAVAVLRDRAGRALLQRRPAGRACAGYWEFPGGKIDDGESTAAALARELREEIGIEPTAFAEWIARAHAYRHGAVDLRFARVREWRGAPVAREGQELGWFSPAAPPPRPFLAANEPIWKWLSLPDICALVDLDSRPGIPPAETFWGDIERGLRGGLRMILIRAKTAAAPTSQIAAIARRARFFGALVVLNGDEKIARAIDADGWHASAARLRQSRRRPDFRFVGASCHDERELSRARELGADYALLSPVRETISHPQTPPLGWPRFAAAAREARIPVYALGGMTPRDLETAQANGAHGVALLRAAWRLRAVSRERDL